MSWIVGQDLDRNITLLRNQWEAKNNKSISKKSFLMKLIYENPNMKTVLEQSGIRIDKKLTKLPKL